jgi:hypothetical protein
VVAWYAVFESASSRCPGLFGVGRSADAEQASSLSAAGGTRRGKGVGPSSATYLFGKITASHHITSPIQSKTCYVFDGSGLLSISGKRLEASFDTVNERE